MTDSHILGRLLHQCPCTSARVCLVPLLTGENMLWDDIIYLFLLLTTIGLGEVLRRIDNAKIKQNIATSVGLTIVFIVSGFHTLHCVLTTAVNALIIRFFPSK